MISIIWPPQKYIFKCQVIATVINLKLIIAALGQGNMNINQNFDEFKLIHDITQF